jgi:ferredoxin-nitrate reductase
MSTNSERQVAYSAALVPPPGAALPDWEIICRVARSLGCRGFDFHTPGEVWDEWIGLTAGRLCDQRGMPFDRLLAERNLQWPCPHPDHPGTKRLYLDRQFPTPDGRARLLYRPHVGPKEPVDHEFPLALTTGRLYAHWHTQTRTGKVRQLVERDQQPFVELHPQTADQAGIVDGQWVQLSSRRGTVQLPARVTDRVPPAMVFVPIHWGDTLAPGNAVNYLTISAVGRVAKQPELKFCAVTVEPLAPAPSPAEESR